MPDDKILVTLIYPGIVDRGFTYPQMRTLLDSDVIIQTVGTRPESKGYPKPRPISVTIPMEEERIESAMKAIQPYLGRPYWKVNGSEQPKWMGRRQKFDFEVLYTYNNAVKMANERKGNINTNTLKTYKSMKEVPDFIKEEVEGLDADT